MGLNEIAALMVPFDGAECIVPLTFQEACGAAELPIPVVPASWADCLTEREPGLFTTRVRTRPSMDDLESFGDAVLSGTVSNGLDIRIPGRPASRQELSYYLVEEDLVLLLRSSLDRPQAVDPIRELLATLRVLVGEHRYQTANGAGFGARLVVQSCDWIGLSRWGWMPRQPLSISGEASALDDTVEFMACSWSWNFADDPLGASLRVLEWRRRQSFGLGGVRYCARGDDAAVGSAI